MRLHLITTPNERTVPFNYQQKLVGTLHKWMGKDNDEHGRMSLYSFSWLHNGKISNDGFVFQEGARWFVSFYSDEVLRRLIGGIQEDPEMFDGLVVTDVSIENTPDLSHRSYFFLGSPVLIKERDSLTGNIKQYTFKDEIAAVLMTNTLRHKMKIAGVDEDESLNIRFDLNYANKRTKFLSYRGIGNRASLCPIIIEGTPETKEFAWNVGIGNSTGVGFGSIY